MYRMPEWDVSDPVFEALMRLRQSWEGIQRMLAVDLDALHTTLFQIDILVLLRSAEVPLSPSDIAAYTFRTAHTVSETISRMHEAGYVNKVRTGEDQRAVKVSITPQGEQLLEKSMPAALRPSYETIRHALSREELVLLSQLLKKLRDGVLHDLGGRSEPPPVDVSWMFPK